MGALTYSASTTYTIYATNSSTTYSDTSSSATGLTQQYSLTSSSSIGVIDVTITDTNCYRYGCILAVCIGANPVQSITNVHAQRAAGGYKNLVLNADYTISTDSSTGYPLITYTDS